MSSMYAPSEYSDVPLLGWGTPSPDEQLFPLSVHSMAYESARIIKTGPGILYGFTAYSSNAAAQFIQIFDAATLPAAGAIPAVLLSVAASSTLGVNWLPGRAFLVGIVIANSTTGPTRTAGAADTWFDAQFV
jgi:hypothetical protein